MKKYTLLLLACLSHFVYYYNVINGVYPSVFFLVICSIVSLSLGYILWININTKTIFKVKTVFFNSYKSQKVLAYFFIAVGIVSYIYFYCTYGVNSYYDSYGISRGKGYITVFFNFWLLGLIIFEYISYSKNNKKDKWLNRVFILIYIFINFCILSKRRPILILFIVLIYIWKDKIFSSTKKRLCFYGATVVFVIVFSIFGKIRGILDYSDFATAIEYVIGNFSTEMISLSNFEGKYISRTLNDIYEYVLQNGHEPSVLFGTLYCMIPRDLFDGLRPLSFSEWYTSHFYYEYYIHGVGLAGSFIGELFLIGGLFFVVLGYFSVGFFCASIQKYGMKHNFIKNTLVYSLFLYNIMVLPRYELSALVIDFVFLYVPILLLCNYKGKMNLGEIK